MITTITYTPILKYSRIGRTRQSSHSTRCERVDSTSTRLAHGYLVVARLCFTPHLAVHRGIHTRRACVRTPQCHFLVVSHRFFSLAVLTPADLCDSVTSTSGISCNLAVRFDIPPRQKTVSKTKITPRFSASSSRAALTTRSFRWPLAFPVKLILNHTLQIMPSTRGSTSKLTIP